MTNQPKRVRLYTNEADDVEACVAEGEVDTLDIQPRASFGVGGLNAPSAKLTITHNHLGDLLSETGELREYMRQDRRMRWIARDDAGLYRSANRQSVKIVNIREISNVEAIITLIGAGNS